MILLDYSQIALSNIIVQKLNDEDMIRHMILNSIRMYNKKYRHEYGQMVICADGANTWRRDYFPQYKGMRKKNRKESDQDWTEIFRILNLVREEIRENLPYKVLHLEGCEADDIIGTLAMKTQEFGQHEPVMIISSDKDFIQLHKYNNVKQYSPIQKKMVVDKNPRSYCFDHICRGDKGDGIPNIASPDSTFVNGGRQKPMRKKIIDQIANTNVLTTNEVNEEIKRNYARNQQLVDLSYTPQELQDEIVSAYTNYEVKDRSGLFNYFVNNKLKNLMENLGEF